MNPYRLPSPPSRPPDLRQRFDWVALLWAAVAVAAWPGAALLAVVLVLPAGVLCRNQTLFGVADAVAVFLLPFFVYREVASARFFCNTVQGPL